VEAAARESRYAFLERAARRVGADCVAVGHTSDDQAETVLLRLCRGCGLRGVSAMAPSRSLAAGGAIRLVRPLLGMSREDVERYLRGAGIRFRKDETNRSAAWTRNRVRRRILPLLSREIHPGAPRALARFAAQAAEAYRVVSARADEAERRCRIRRTPRGGAFRLAGLVSWPPAVRAEIWMRLLERFAGGAPFFSEIDLIEEVVAGRRPAASLRGGRLRVRRAAKDLTWSVHEVP
jgi:tRNA(Ile)-lysidine synthase